jgi:hypothetical protein
LEISDLKAYAMDSFSRLNFTDTINGMNIFNIWVYGEIEKEGSTYLKLGNITIDTIFVKYREVGNSIFISELYYNGKLIEGNESVGECGGAKVHEITVVKE